jgi:hypothetical protein
MRRRVGLGVSGIAVVSALAFCAPVSAETFVIAHAPLYPYNGLALGATGPSGCPAPYCSVASDDLDATGRVVGGGPYPDCDAVYHYHGTLFGQPDPAPNGCGWGEVLPITSLQSEAAVVSSAITLETDALRTKNPHQAKHATGAALSDLKSLSDHSENLDEIQKQKLKQATTEDKIAKRFFQQADDDEVKSDKKEDVKTARRHIEDGLELKHQLFDDLVFFS